MQPAILLLDGGHNVSQVKWGSSNKEERSSALVTTEFYIVVNTGDVHTRVYSIPFTISFSWSLVFTWVNSMGSTRTKSLQPAFFWPPPNHVDKIEYRSTIDCGNHEKPVVNKRQKKKKILLQLVLNLQIILVEETIKLSFFYMNILK